MKHKVFILLAVAGLFVFALAGPRPDSPIPTRRPGEQLPDRDSIRMLRARAKGAVLPSGIDVNKVIERVRPGPKPEPLSGVDASPYGAEFMPASTSFHGSLPQWQYHTAVAFDGINYLVVWVDWRPGDYLYAIYGARVSQSGSVLDPNGILISTVDYWTADNPSVAFDGDQYLVVWQDFSTGYWENIFGALVSKAGEVTPLTSAINPTPSGNHHHQQPSVAFDGDNYLVAWQEFRSGYYDIYGALVSKAGGVTALTNPISAAGNDQLSPSVAFDNTNYLVVWQDNRNVGTTGWDIFGALVSKTGVVTDLTSAISAAANAQAAPSVAFDNTNYLVVWQDNRNSGTTGWDIFGAQVSKTGVVTGLTSAISAEVDAQQVPSVAFDGTNYLVVWEDWRNDYSHIDVYGARVNQSGSVLDVGGFLISTNTATSNQYGPSVDFDGTNCLVVWEDDPDGSDDIYGSRVPTDGGTPLDPDGFAIATATNGLHSPSVAFDGTEYLVVWTEALSMDEKDIYGCQVSLEREENQEYEAYLISTRTSNNYPVVACGPAEGTAMVAYQSFTGDPYFTNRVWARRATLPLDGNVGATSIVRPVTSYLYTEECYDIPPVARVYNYGTETRSFKAKFTITPPLTGGYSSTKTVLGLRPHTSRSVEFDPYPLTVGLFTPKCSTMLTGEVNATQGNDSVTAFFQGCDTIIFFDLVEDGFSGSPTNTWARDTPVRPTWTRPPMDSFVWGNRVTGQYGNNENSYLTSPTYVATQASPSIAFQHSFQTQASRDGGNFWYSITEWADSAAPTYSAGLAYNGVVAALEDEEEQQGWSGNSNGWKQSVFTIPVAKDAQFKVRWHFASDEATTSYGWLLDEVACINCDIDAYADKPRQGIGSLIDTMSVAPNPVHGDGQLSYTLVRNCNVSIKLYDAAGRLAARLTANGSGSGAHTAAVDATRLQPGVYFLTIAGNGDAKTTKVIIE